METDALPPRHWRRGAHHATRDAPARDQGVIAAGGNADVDIELLQKARFRPVIVHDDAEREYAVTNGSEKFLTVLARRDFKDIASETNRR